MVSIDSNYSSFVPQNSFQTNANILKHEENQKTIATEEITDISQDTSSVNVAEIRNNKEQSFVKSNSVQVAANFLQSADATLTDIAGELSKMKNIAESSVSTASANDKKFMQEQLDICKDNINQKFNIQFNGKKVLFNAETLQQFQQKTESELIDEGYEVAKIDKVSGKLANSSDKIIINTSEQFVAMSKSEEMFDKQFALSADIDLAESCNKETGSWCPIGNDNTKFSGTFDGNNHTVRNLFASGESCQGLFGQTENAVIKNVSLKGANITSTDNLAGALVARQGGGKISNCHTEGSVSSKFYAGGFVGASYGNIESCGSECDVRGKINIGGFAGFVASGTIKNAYSHGDVEGSDFVGGFAGTVDGKIENVYTTSTVKVEGEHGGYLEGTVSGNISGSFFNSDNKINSQINKEQFEKSANSGLPIDEFSNSNNFKDWDTAVWDFSQTMPALKNIPSNEGSIKIDILTQNSETSMFYNSAINLNLNKNNITEDNSIGQTVKNIDNALNEVSIKQNEIGNLLNKVEDIFDSDIEQSTKNQNIISISSFQEAETQNAILKDKILKNLPFSVDMTTCNINKDFALNLV